MTCRTLGAGLAMALVSLTSCSGDRDERKSAAPQTKFSTPEAAAESLIAAAERFDVPSLKAILGPDGVDLVVTEDQVQDRNQSTAFAAEARKQTRVVRDSTNAKMANVIVGPGEWPLPIPIIEENGAWRFDTEAGREEILRRRIGGNELDAIDVCQGYVEAQREYALTKHDGAKVNQYAQKVISTPGKHDGLAWQGADGSWQGPVGEGIARVIAEGYTDKINPYHGYYFKVLKAQGPAAQLGEMDYVVKGAMIGGFALAAAPAEYGVTGIKTFIVNHDGIVYEQDLGENTLNQFRAMERFNPDSSWSPVTDGDAAAAVEEQTEFDAILTAGGDKKIQVIRVVRAITGLGLKEAKDLVDNAPKPIKEKVSKAEALDIKAKIEESGGVVDVKVSASRGASLQEHTRAVPTAARPRRVA